MKAHLAAIHALPAVKKESSVELRKLLESTNEHVQSLEAMMLPVNHWDAKLVYWLLEKLDAESRKQFELAHSGTDVLTFKELTTFMDRRSRALESSCDQPEVSTPKTTPKKVHQEAYSSTVEHSASCQMKECSGSHSISQCDRYKKLSMREKKAVVRKLKLCMNCLGRHFVADCPSKFSCHTCNGRHHTSLHFDRAVEQQWCDKWCNVEWSICASINSNGWHRRPSWKDIDVPSLAGLWVSNILHHSRRCIKTQSCTFSSRREDLWDWWTATSSQGVCQCPSGSTKVAYYSTNAELNRR